MVNIQIIKTDYLLICCRGAEANKSCVFPFKYKEGGMTNYIMHYGCVTYGYEVFPYSIDIDSPISIFSPGVPLVMYMMVAIIGVGVVLTVRCMKIP